MPIVELVGAICGRDVTSMSAAEVGADAADVARVGAWVDARRVAHARRLAVLAAATPSLDPECALATAGRSGRRDAEAAVRRGRLLDDAPAFEQALTDGVVCGAHVDALERAARRLDGDSRDELLGDAGSLAMIAGSMTPEQFDRLLSGKVGALRADGGVAMFEQQRQDTSLRIWREARSGMYRMSASFDPESGLALRGRLANAVEALFHDRVPDTCPTDNELKQHHLRALALLRLTAGPADGSEASIGRVGARTEVIVVVDQATLLDGLHARSLIDAGDRGHLLPVDTYRRMGCTAGLIPAVLSSAGVVVDLGRTVRVASTAQRRALAAMYATCAIPGCDVRARHCQPHHIAWWRNGGSTDLENLLPLCSRHHHSVHEGGWALQLAPDRRLTVTFPDGTATTGGPPAHQRAGP